VADRQNEQATGDPSQGRVKLPLSVVGFQDRTPVFSSFPRSCST
jgi:hypothetical protein